MYQSTDAYNIQRSIREFSGRFDRRMILSVHFYFLTAVAIGYEVPAWLD
jgi:hypothetical protein